MKIFYNIIYKIDNNNKLILKCNRKNCNLLHKNFFLKINKIKQKILELNIIYYNKSIKIKKKEKLIQLKNEKEKKIKEIENNVLKSKKVILLKNCSFKECNILYKIGINEIKKLIKRICFNNINKKINKRFINGNKLFNKLYIKFLNKNKMNLRYKDFKYIEKVIKKKYNIKDPFALYSLPIYYKK